MKKMMSFILAVAMSAAVAVPVFAENPTTTKDGDSNSWTTSGQNEAYAGKMMTMIAYAPAENGSITVDSIQYIDQTTADENGAYSFSNYIPKDLPTKGSYTVKVGSEALDEAISAGAIEKIEITDVAVAGTITTQSENANATISFYSGNSEAPVKTAETTKGAFNLSIAPGTYDVVISRPGYLKHTIKNVVVGDALTLADVKLLPGDVDSNGVVNITDIGAIVDAFGAEKTGDGTGKYNVAYDFDVSNVININDLGVTVNNFGREATTVDCAGLSE